MKDEKDQDNQSSLEDFFGSSNTGSGLESEQSNSDRKGTHVQTSPAPSLEAQTSQSRGHESKSRPTQETNDETSLDFDDVDEIIESVFEEEDSVIKNAGYRETPSDLAPSYLLSVDYAGGDIKKALARLYNPETKKIYFWYDNTDHKPYCYTDYPEQVVTSKVGRHPGFLRTESVQLKDLLRDQMRAMTKVIADDPLSIGGKRDSIRERLIETTPDMATVSHAWEANIRYRNCYTYDRDLVMGLPYKIVDGNLIRCDPKVDEAVLKEFKKTIGDSEGLERIVNQYAPLFFTEVPDIRRIALDIEVYAPVKNRIPDASLAEQQVTAIGLSDNEGLNKCFVLKRKGHPEGEKTPDYPKELQIVYYDNEKDMITQAFRVIDRYPIVLTFVGDSFDLNYLYHRAKRLGVDMDKECPIRMGNDIAMLHGGIHVDLYRFLKNPSIRLYALSGAYEHSSLEAIGQGLLGTGKLNLSTEINDLPYNELAYYCWLDSNITLRITQYDENLVLRLIILLMRISRLSMEDATRFGISSWIQSLFRQEHRSRGFIIPQQWEIQTLKSSAAQTEAMIKDKAFKGAIVIEPVAGVHFNSTVLDFASLYPTIMKTHNISYETVDCPHDVCKNAKNNRVPETDHWICTINRGMISETIGFFRDTRVNWFKGKSKDKTLDPQIRHWYTVVEKALKVFVNACLPADEEVIIRTSQGIVEKRRISELADDWRYLEILSIENDFTDSHFGKPIFVPIKGFSNSGKSQLRKITLRDGRTFTCTPNHVLPVLRPRHPRGKPIPKQKMYIEEIAVEDLKLEDGVFFLQDIPLSKSPPKKLFIPDIIDTSDLYVAVPRDFYRTSSYRTNQETNDPLIMIVNELFFYSKVSKKYKAVWDEIPEDKQKIIKDAVLCGAKFEVKIGNESGPWMNSILPLSKNFFSILGWYIAEGSCDKNRIQIAQYESNNPDNCAEIQSLFGKLRWPLGKYNGRQFVINSVVVMRIMESLCGSGAKHKHIPIHLLDKENARILLASYFKGDGNLVRGSKRYSTASKQLAFDLVLVLGSLGRFASIQGPDNVGMYRVLETRGRHYRRKGRGLIQYNNTYPVRVKSIETLPAESVYDLETENGWFTTTNGCIVHNSYGVTGAQHFELFCMPAAESVTAYGRNAIMKTKEKAESMGVRVLYGDTDSVFLDNPTKEQQQNLVEWSRKELGIDLEVEKTYKYVALSDRKKNYIGVYDSGYVEVKGLSGKKRNTPLFVQNAFKEMLDVLARVDNPEGFETAREEIREIVYRVLNRLEGKAEEYSPEELAFRVQLTKSLSAYGDVKPQHVRAAMMSDEELGPGSIVEYIKTKDREGVLPVSMAKNRSYWIDKDKYIETLKSVFEQVLDAVGLNFESLMGFTTLDEFF